MPSNESQSNSSQSTSTATTDNRVGADNGAVVIQQGGSQNISFSPDVAKFGSDVVNSIVDFSNRVVSTAGSVVHDSLAAQEKATNAVLDFGKSALAAAPSTSPSTAAGIISSQTLSNLNIPLLIGGAVLLFLILKKKG